MACPTDSGYALVARLGDQKALNAIGRIRQVGKTHNYTLLCAAMGDVGRYARVDNDAFRWLKAHLPGPYTFVLRATGETPRKAQNDRRRTIGIRIPDHPVVAGLLNALGEPMISSTLILPGEDAPLTDAHDIREQLGTQLEVIIDAGPCHAEPTTVVDLSGGQPEVLRAGGGPTTPFD